MVAIPYGRLQRGADVVELDFDPRRPGRLLRALGFGCRPAEQVDEVGPVPDGGRRGFTGGCQPVGAVLLDRFQEAVPGITAVVVRHNQGFVHQRAEDVEHLDGGDGPVGRHRFCSVEGEATGEDGKPAEDGRLGFGEQVEAPVD